MWFVILRGKQWLKISEVIFSEHAVDDCSQTLCDEAEPGFPFVTLRRKGEQLLVPAGDIIFMANVDDPKGVGFIHPEDK